MNKSSRLDRQLSRLSGLAEDQRRRLYAVVTAAATPMSREEAATAVGMSRSLAAYHLDRLVADGLLEVRFERRTGRTGPGAGRPAKLYLRSSQPVEFSMPARDYAFLAELMARAIEREPSGASHRALVDTARQAGADLGLGPEAVSGTQSGTLKEALEDVGFEPYSEADGTVRLRNCPFHRLAERHRELVCTANLAFVEGLAARLGDSGQPQLDPRPGECCVALKRDDDSEEDL